MDIIVDGKASEEFKAATTDTQTTETPTTKTPTEMTEEQKKANGGAFTIVALFGGFKPK